MLKSKKGRGILQVLFSLTLLAILLQQVGWQEVASTLVNVDWRWYLPAFLLFLLNVLIRAYRWYILLHTLNERPSYLLLTYLYFVGFFANNFIPSGFGGDVVKVVSLRQRYGQGTEALSSVVMDRVTGLMGSAIIALLALGWNASSHTTTLNLPLAMWITIAVTSAGIPAAFLFLRWSEPLAWASVRLPALSRMPYYDKLVNLVDTVKRYPFPALVKSLLISLPFTINLVFIQYCLARAFDAQVPLAAFFLFVPLIALINTLPITFNGLGVREGAFLFLFVPIGVPPETAVAMSLAFYFLRFAAGMVGGALYAISSLTQALRAPRAKNLQ